MMDAESEACAWLGFRVRAHRSEGASVHSPFLHMKAELFDPKHNLLLSLLAKSMSSHTRQ